MLFPGKHHLRVPTGPRKNLLFRRWLLRKCRKPGYQKLVMQWCKEDILFWINAFAYQFNPDLSKVGPFITWPFQDEAIREVLDAVEAREDVRWQKSREVGASWVVLLIIDWLCLFHTNNKALVLSRDEDAVDRVDDPDSLFWKLRHIHKHLPLWMTGPIRSRTTGPQGRAEGKGIIDRKLGFHFERTNSYINGEANVASAGVGGRAAIALVDEFGQFKNGHETYSMTSDTANCRVFVFTHKDSQGMAYNLCFDAKFAGMREIITHWSHHPVKRRGLYRYDEDKNRIEVLDTIFKYPANFKFVMEARPTGGPFPGIRSPWYDKQCIRRTERDVSMNLDIDPRGSSDRFFDTYRISVIKQRCREPDWLYTLKFDKERGLPLELVEDPKGLLKLWVNPRSPVLLPKLRAGAGVDVSAGSGNSPSCLSIFNAQTGEKVLEYANALIYANDFAAFCAAVCRMIEDKHGNHPLLSWEVQGSAAFERKLREIGYENMYVSRAEDKLGKPIDNYGRLGVSTKTSVQLAMMEAYRTGLYEGEVLNYSAEALDECLKFVYTGRGVEYQGTRHAKKVSDEGSGAKIHHGDQVIADALAIKMIGEMGYAGQEPTTSDPEWISPTTMAGRMKLFEQEQREIESYDWV